MSSPNFTPPTVNGDDMAENVEDETAVPQSEGNIDVDTTAYFVTDMVFDSKEAVLDWARRTGRVHGVVVVVIRSDLSENRKKPRLILGCERSGRYKKNRVIKVKKGASTRRSSSKKCECPFSMKAQLIDKKTNKWALHVVNGKHNHGLMKVSEGHSYLGRLTKDEKEIVARLGKTGVGTKEMLNQIKLKDPTNASTLKTIRNVRSALRAQEMAGRTHMQHLFKMLTDLGYVTRHCSDPVTMAVTDIFWAYSPSIELARSFPFVFMLDCMYKTNKYQLPLLEFVGVTSTNKTFAAAFCYMSFEKEENYVWALQCFKEIFDDVTCPGVFVTGREPALMNALKKVFPDAKNLLCRVHIEKDVLTNCNQFFSVKSDFDEFMQVWACVIHSESEEEFDENIDMLFQKFQDFPAALSYLFDSWLTDYRTYFVSAWIDQFFHLGNTTTNRVEGTHAELKKYLATSIHGFIGSLEAIHLLLEGQITQIRASFEESLTRIPHQFRQPMYKELVGVVSTACLEKIQSELQYAENSGLDPHDCNHKIFHSFGLPCAHKLLSYKREGRSIPLTDVHGYWRKLNLSPYSEETLKVTIDSEIELIYRTFMKATIPQQLEIRKQLLLLGNASITPLLEPIQKVNMCGRKKKKSTTRGPQEKIEHSTKRELLDNHVFEDVASTEKSETSVTKRPKLEVHRTRNPNTEDWITVFPQFIQPYISKVVNVPGDGHCGYRVVAKFLGMGDDGWRNVRRELSQELKSHYDEYNKILNPLTSTENLIASVECEDQVAGPKYWMTMPSMGNVIASCYKTPVVLISQSQCITFFPLRDPTPFEGKQNILVLGLINRDHFVMLELVDESPIPPTSKLWHEHRHMVARHWHTMYAYRMDKFKSLIDLQNIDIATVEILDFMVKNQ